MSIKVLENIRFGRVTEMTATNQKHFIFDKSDQIALIQNSVKL